MAQVIGFILFAGTAASQDDGKTLRQQVDRDPEISAQTSTPRQSRPRIRVTPGRLLYRECVADVREVWRPYWGYIVYPGMRCWWVRG
jgi:hypothetical protein